MSRSRMTAAAEPRSLALSYGLWALGMVGLCGLQRFYLGQLKSGTLYLLTFGFCGIGQLLDLILLPDAVKQANARLELTEQFAAPESPAKGGQARSAAAIMAYRHGLDAQTAQNHREALGHYRTALDLETDTRSKSFVHYNMALSHEALGDRESALASYRQSIALNLRMPHACNNMAAIYRALGEEAETRGDHPQADQYFETASTYWRRALLLAPRSFPEASQWLAGRRTAESKPAEESESETGATFRTHLQADAAGGDGDAMPRNDELADLIRQARESMQRMDRSDLD